MPEDKRRTDTKMRIFAASLELFSEKGVDSVSIRDIARSVGISPAGFYNHFESKDDLLESMYRYYRGALIPSPESAVSGLDTLIETLGPVEAVVKLLETAIASAKDGSLEKLGRIISMEKERNPVAAEIARQDRESFVDAMESFFEAIASSGVRIPGNGKDAGRIFGYMMLGVFEDNKYRRYIRNESFEAIVREQSEIVRRLLPVLIGG